MQQLGGFTLQLVALEKRNLDVLLSKNRPGQARIDGNKDFPSLVIEPTLKEIAAVIPAGSVIDFPYLRVTHSVQAFLDSGK